MPRPVPLSLNLSFTPCAPSLLTAFQYLPMLSPTTGSLHMLFSLWTTSLLCLLTLTLPSVTNLTITSSGKPSPMAQVPYFMFSKLFILLLHDPYHRCVYLRHPSINVCVFHSVVSFFKIGICGHFCSPPCLWYVMQCSAHGWF